MFKLFSKKEKVDLPLKETITEKFVLNKLNNFQNEETPIEDILVPFLNSYYKNVEFEKLNAEEKKEVFSKYVLSLNSIQRNLDLITRYFATVAEGGAGHFEYFRYDGNEYTELLKALSEIDLIDFANILKEAKGIIDSSNYDNDLEKHGLELFSKVDAKFYDLYYNTYKKGGINQQKIIRYIKDNLSSLICKD